jgi:serine-type D-Ala-D-Ala carboxypeptidase (penicillin-binding protein 5/6)
VRPGLAGARRIAPAAVAIALIVLVASGMPAQAAPRIAKPDPQAEAAIVVDARTGEVLLEQGADERHPIASATKLMTALLALERASPQDVFTAARYQAAPIESQIGLRTGERMRVRDLLTALLLESANDAAATIAANVSGSRRAFVRDMNRRADELGLRSTSYTNPIGFDSRRNRSSARDLATLARRLLQERAFSRTVDRPQARLRSGARRRTVRNRNTLVGAYPFVEGVKTGRTQEAGYVLVGAGEGRGARVVSVVLGAQTEAARNESTLALLRWGLDQFRRVRVVDAGRAVARVPVAGRDGMRVALESRRSATTTVRRGRRPTLRVRAPDEIEGPLAAGRPVAALEVRDGPRVVRTVPLVTASAIPAPKPLAELPTAAWAGLGLTSLALVAIVSVVMLRARGRLGARGRRTTTSGR